MDRFLSRLERTFLGKLAIERLTLFIVGGMVMAFVLITIRPEFYLQLYLEPRLIAQQPWRLVTYLFLPPTTSMLWVLFSLYFFWLMGTGLEQTWGAFKFNVYYLLGAIGTTIAAVITQVPQGNFWLNTSVYLGFATVFPDYTIVLFFILPVRIKWLAMLTAAFIGYEFVVGDVGTKASIAIAMGNYLLFFGGHLYGLFRGQRLVARQAQKRAVRQGRVEPPVVESRACAICGAKQDEGADIRVCSCEKCGGKPRDLCLEHARNH